MTDLCLIHSSDLHLGKRFARFPTEIGGRLTEARHAVLARLAAAAREAGARHVLVAGDVFDTESPSPQVVRQALAAMADDPGLTWWLMPGNHDSLAAEALWESVLAAAPDTVRVLTSAAPVEIAPGAWLLPAPLPRRFPGLDLTEAMARVATPEAALRIGLAHGRIAAFHDDDSRSAEVIAPDRAERAGLDYLALGDWHGQRKAGPRCWYAGAPEYTGFRHTGRGACLSVRLGTGAPPEVTRVETGRFHWQAAELSLIPEADPVAMLEALLPASQSARRDHLMAVAATGRAGLADQARLVAAADAVTPAFGHFELTCDGLATEFAATDLDEIDRAGALRLAADRLAAQAADEGRTPEARRIAEAALNRLYSYLHAGEGA